MSGSSRSRSRSIRRSRSRDYERRRSNRSRSTSNRGRSHRRSRSTSPLSDRKRHTSDRENPQPSKCLGIFGLSTRTTEADLRDVFDRYPGFLDVKIISDYNTGISRGFGFLNFESYDDARYVKDKCVGMDIDGRNIRIDFSTTTRAHTPTPGRYMGRPSHSGRPRYGGGRERDYGGGRERDYGGGRDRDYGGGRDRDYGGGREREYGGRGNRYNNERRRHSRSYSRSPRRY